VVFPWKVILREVRLLSRWRFAELRQADVLTAQISSSPTI
jgi:hypothetical protein